MNNLIGTRLRERRLLKKITQEQLGSILGVQKAAVYKWEKGINKPNPEILLKLSEILECTTDYLIGKTNVPNANYYSYLDSEDGLIEMEYDSSHKLTQEQFIMFINELKISGYDVDALFNKVKNETSKN